MRLILVLAMVPFSSALAAEGQVTRAVDYSHCRTTTPPYGYFLGNLNEKGDFEVDPKGPGVSKISNSEDGNVQTVSVRYPWAKGALNSSYVLTKNDGHTQSIEVKSTMEQSVWQKLTTAHQAWMMPPGTTVTRFGFKDDHCYVDQMAQKYKDGHEVITYDHQACEQVLEAVKSIGAKKVQECGPVAFAIQNAVNMAEKRVNGPKTQLALGTFPGMAANKPEKSPFSNLMGAFSAASSCSIVRKMYGLPVDPEADVMPGGAFVGGITGMNAQPAPQPRRIDDESVPAQ